MRGPPETKTSNLPTRVFNSASGCINIRAHINQTDNLHKDLAPRWFTVFGCG